MRTPTRVQPRKVASVAGLGLAVLMLLHAVPGYGADHGQRCGTPAVQCGAAPAAAFDEAGTLWVVFVHGTGLYLSRSDDAGRQYSNPVQVTTEPERIRGGGENRPKIAFGPAREIYLSWTRMTSNRGTAAVRFARSLDGGRSFAPPRNVNDDGRRASRQYDALAVGADGTIYVAWIEARERAAHGAALHYAVSSARGASFSAPHPIAERSCECCRVALAPAAGGGAAVFWRAIFATGTRDHAFALLGARGPGSPVERPARDDWRIDGCPEDGPAMRAAAGGQYHLAWFTGAVSKRGIHYGRYRPGTPGLLATAVMTTAAGAGHPDVLETGGTVYVVWKIFDGAQTRVEVAQSDDAGAAWFPVRTLTTTRGASDHPFLIARASAAYLAWQTDDEGLRIIAVEPDRSREPRP